MPFENAIYQWDEGRRRLRDAPTVRRPALERVTDQIVAELRRRLGSRFTTGELADPRTLEAEARKLGMVRPTERAYVVKGLPKH